MSKLYEDLVTVERDAGMPASFSWRGRRYEVRDVIGRWRIEGRWWEDGRDREYWRGEGEGGAGVDPYEDRPGGRWDPPRLWGLGTGAPLPAPLRRPLAPPSAPSSPSL